MADFLKRLVPKRFRKKGIVIPVVRLHGPIMSGGSRFRPALNLSSVAGQLEKAFDMKDSRRSHCRSTRRAARPSSRA